MLIQLLYILGGSTVLIWLGKLIISKSFDAGIERYKHELNKQIEGYKAEIGKLNHEHNTRFTRLHEERIQRIKQLYSLVVELETALVEFVELANGIDQEKDKTYRNTVVSKRHELMSLLEKEMIFFSDKTVSKVEVIIKEAWEIILKKERILHLDKEYDRKVFSETEAVMHSVRWEKINTDIDQKLYSVFRELKTDLRNNFRYLFGIEEK